MNDAVLIEDIFVNQLVVVDAPYPFAIVGSHVCQSDDIRAFLKITSCTVFLIKFISLCVQQILNILESINYLIGGCK